MNIVLFSALYKPSIGGVENYTEQMARTLQADGHHVSIITYDISTNPSFESLPEGNIIRLPCHPLMNGRLPLPRCSKLNRRLWKNLKELETDGIVINTRFYPLSILAAKFAKQKGIRPIVLEHGSAHLTFNQPIVDIIVRLYEHSITLLLKHYKPSFYAVSKKSAEWLTHFGIKADGIIPNAIDAPAWRKQASPRDFRQEQSIRPSTPIVSFVGRLVPEKGILQLIEAMRQLEEGRKTCMLLVAGSGTLFNQLKNNLPNNAKLLGSLSKPDVAALLLQSSLYCLPSRSEGFATSLLEAAASGTPTLTTNVGGCDELIPDERYGFLLKDASANSIAKGITEALTTVANDAEMGARIRNRVEDEYSWERSCELLTSALIRNKLA
ncbi:glycosyltransferase family 4 protein [Collinsella sp. An307]|uniref:glycosyltransferase family 4 protein n=1 Tax=Collinsella sp. An307 TaxID=1965630 RepID=UPI000B36656F|nr:glycosyltransferase family 4 protein [Collinsella sp. An307]OUO21809.1 hypothetical protein B5F89_02915 [Collinsella sp. An307]